MGIFDNLMQDPDQQGLLGAAAGLLNASGPSRMPVSLGQVLGAGLQGGVQGYKSAQDQKRAQTALDLQNAQLAQALRQGQINSELYGRLLGGLQGGGQGNPQDPGAQSAPQQAGGNPVPAIGQPSQTGGQSASQQAGGGTNNFGLSANGILGGMLAGPGELGKAIVAANAPTDLTKQLRQAGIDPESALGHQIMQQNIAKQNYIAPVNARPGSIIRDPNDPSKVLAFNPTLPEGGTPQFDAQGNVTSISPIPGVSQIVQGLAQAKNAGANSVEPMAGVDASGNPAFTNKLAAAGGGAPSFQVSPQQQAQRDQGRMAILQQELAQTTNPADVAALQREIARTQPAGALRPAAAPGFNTSQDKIAGAAADRYTGLVQQASDSPTRINVYDNIMNLSKAGVATGPTQDWWNNIKGALAGTPGIGKMVPGMKDDVSNYQEINKFLYQNAQRNWQAAGGTGTDSQLEAFSQSSPNATMFPQALQAMAQWGKAGELALQAKANAAQQFKDQNNGNVVNLDQFDRAWRNNLDPVLFQLKTMDPSQAATYVNNLKQNDPKAYQTLMLKASALKNMGGL